VLATTTTTTLTEDLYATLTAAGLDTEAAVRVAHIPPPTGRHWLHTYLTGHPNAAQQIADMWRDDLADRLKVTTAEAEDIRDLFWEATR
jgi:hypothetical protein